MDKIYTTSKETAKYLDAVVLLQKGASVALNACEDVYGTLSSTNGSEHIRLFQEKLDEAIDELFKLMQANIEINLGFIDNFAKAEVQI